MVVVTYPRLDDLFARRALGRAARARLSFGEKLDILEELRSAADRFKAIRVRSADDRPDQLAAACSSGATA